MTEPKPKLDITPTEQAAINIAVTTLFDVHGELCAVGHLLYELWDARYQADNDAVHNLFGNPHVQENITIALSAVNEVKRLLQRDVLKLEVPDAPEMRVQHPA